MPSPSVTASTFQPTLPARGATLLFLVGERAGKISTHAPRTGSDQRQMADIPQLPSISTHAPRTGSDTALEAAERLGLFQPTLPARGATGMGRRYVRLWQDFNPRSPHGERPVVSHACGLGADFNPRSPHGERPSWVQTIMDAVQFQPTLPARGATHHWERVGMGADHFNPRSPHGERPKSSRAQPGRMEISTHAPRTGSDADYVENSDDIDISTHAPRTGSDGKRAGIHEGQRSFQPTLPARGATAFPRPSPPLAEPFQPTLPARGATCAGVLPSIARRAFQPTLPARGATA